MSTPSSRARAAAGTALLAAGVLAVMPPHAQGQAPAGETRSTAILEEVVVTAERREASLQDVPVPITAITADAIEKLQVTSAQDLARYTPSLKMTNNLTTPTNLSPSLRGSTLQDASQIVAESPFGIYVDDVYIARLNSNNVTLADIERVEVLRGPQGTLYGRNTLAGAMKFVSRTPGEDRWLKVALGVGNFDQQRVSIAAGGPLGNDGWAGSFAAQYLNKDGQFFNRNASVNDDVGLERSWAARGKLHYSSEPFDVTASLSYAKADNDAIQLIPASTPTRNAMQQFTSDDVVPQFGTYTLNTPQLTRVPSIVAPYPRGENEQLIGILNALYDLGGARLRSITGYVSMDDFFSTDFSGTGLVNGASDATGSQFSEELQLLGTAADDRLKYLAGVYYFKETAQQNIGWNTWFGSGTAVFPISTTRGRITTESYAAFAQGDFNFTPALKGTLGLRYTKERKSFDFLFNNLLAPPGTPAGVVSLDRDYSVTTPRVGVDYQVPVGGSASSLLLYASAARGFKSGGFNGINIFNLESARTPYDPESNWTYEAGIKTDLLDQRLRINANYFIAKVKDLLLTAQTSINTVVSFPIQNAGDATIQGLEFEITAVPADGLTIFLSGTAATDGEYTSLRAGSDPLNASTTLGITAVPPQLPDYSLNVGLEYGRDVSFGRFSIGADWFHTAEYPIAAGNDFVVSAYGVGNAFVRFSIGERWTVGAQVRNVTDEDTIITGSRGFLGGFLPLRPREYMVTGTYSLE